MSEPHCWDAMAGKDGLILPSIFLGGKSCELDIVSCSSVFKASGGQPIWTAGWG